MPSKKKQKSLVIDSDVASSASETSNPRSINCRQALDKILELQYGLVLTADLQEEWGRHRSRYFRRWLTKMFGSKLQVPLKDDIVINQKLRANLSSNAKSESDAEAMLKDVHLLEAALASDETILSMNSSDRDRFKAICEQIALIQNIIWVNPNEPAEKCSDWLDNGAPDDDFRKLGYRDEP